MNLKTQFGCKSPSVIKPEFKNQSKNWNFKVSRTIKLNEEEKVFLKIKI
jgi:hypothetical protein